MEQRSRELKYRMASVSIARRYGNVSRMGEAIAPRYRDHSQSIFPPIARSVFIARDCCGMSNTIGTNLQEDPMRDLSRAARLEAQVKRALLWFMRLLVRPALAPLGRRPLQLEWDNDVPPFPVLIGEVARAKAEWQHRRLVA